MMNAFTKKYRMIKPREDFDSLGQPANDIRGDFNSGNLSEDKYEISEIRMYISASPGERRISSKRESGFDYTTATHYGITTEKSIKKGSYIVTGTHLWRVDYTVNAGKSHVLVYLFNLI